MTPAATGRRPAPPAVRLRNKGSSQQATDTVVIGAGQAGLTTAYLLQQAGRPYVVLDAKARVGDSWRTRWDSLVMFTPNRFNRLPDSRLPGKADHFTTKDEMADYLEGYARDKRLDIRLGTRVTAVRADGAGFVVTTDHDTWLARNVVVAMANLQAPHTPAFADDIDGAIVQMHSHDFRNADQLPPGRVLIVGVGNAGADIAMDVSRSHETIVAGTPSAAVPFRIEGWFARNVLVRIVRFAGLHILNRRNPIGRRVIPKMEHKGKPLVRVKPKDLAAATRRVGRITGVAGGKPVTEDGEGLDVDAIIWCTGYRPDWDWIEAGGRDDHGRIVQDRGIVSGAPGLYLVGHEFLFAAASDTVTGHQRDARHIVRDILRRRPTRVADAAATRVELTA